MPKRSTEPFDDTAKAFYLDLFHQWGIGILAAAVFQAVGASAASVPAADPVLFDSDLASDTAWTLRLDGGPARAIKVPGGGWNSDQQSPPIQVMKDVKDYVLYERKITVALVQPEQAVKLRFGAVAHGCEVFLDGKLVGDHAGPQVPFEMDLTDFVTPGKEQTLQVKAYHRRHYLLPGQSTTAEVAVGWDYPDGSDDASRKEANTWCGWHGQSKVGYGIVRSIRLVGLPAVHVEDVFVRPSVANKQLTCDVWLQNSTDKDRKLTLRARLSSWNQRDWQYPAIPSVEVTARARSTVKTTIGPIAWELGRESYWWPNIPFHEDYVAQLHLLNLEISEGSRSWQKQPERFGFVEHAEGPFYYTVNGVRVTGFSDATAEGQASFYDSYSSPAWLPPTRPGTGAPESWRRYMRVGINMNRLHCSPPTETMMEAADEVGFMLVPEAPIWGNGLSRYDPQYTPQTYHDMGRACRNHPCVARYSLSNEVRDWPSQWPSAIDDMREVDTIHPLVYELHGLGHGKVEEPKSGGHAWIMEHYTNINEKVGEGKGIRGQGENFWATDKMGDFAVGARVLRMNDWCYLSSWSWINFWPNFLQGMSHDLHAWKVNDHADRADGVDGWGSPLVKFVQQSLNPYLLQDHGVLNNNPGAPRGHEQGQAEWPYQAPVCAAGRPVVRSIEVFNDGLSGNKLTLAWSTHWDRPDGPIAVAGKEVLCEIEPGFHSTQRIEFTASAPGQDGRRLYLVMECRKDGKTVFREENEYLTVVDHLTPSAATFLGVDDKTRGNWRARYGTDGYELEVKETKLPGYAKLQWKNGDLWTYEKATDDVRALEYFANPPTGKDRIAAGRYAQELVFDLNVGETPRRMSLYHLDYDEKSRRQQVTIADALTSETLDQREIGDFSQGRYQTWKIQGNIRVTIRCLAGDNATISGIFLDPPGKPE